MQKQSWDSNPKQIRLSPLLHYSLVTASKYRNGWIR